MASASCSASIVLPQDGSPAESGLFLIDLQGDALVTDELSRSTPSLISLQLCRPRFRLPDVSACAASSSASPAAHSRAETNGDTGRHHPTVASAESEEEASEACGTPAENADKIFDTWGLVEWGEASATRNDASSSFFQSPKCQLHVGSLVLPGRVDATLAQGAALVVVRRVRRQRREPRRVGRPQTSASASLERSSEEEEDWAESVWEVQAIAKEKVTFDQRPTLHPRKKLFADRQESARVSGKAAAPQRRRAKTGQDAVASADYSGEPGKASAWLLGISPQLAEQRDGDWQLLAVDESLLSRILAGESLRLKGVPTLLLADAHGDSRPRRQETLLCCREAVYSVSRNEIDGQLLIALRPADPRHGDPFRDPQGGPERAVCGRVEKESETERRAANLLGVPIVGVCKSILLLEPAVGRTTQIASLLTVRPSPYTLGLLSTCGGDVKEHLWTLAMPRVPHHGAGDKAAERFVLPSSFFLQHVQASEEDLLAGLAGNLFSHSPFHAFRRRKLLELHAARACRESPSADVSEEIDGVKETEEEVLPEVWGSSGFFSSSSCILFLPACGGYCAVDMPLLLGFFQRLLNFFAFLDLSASEDLTVKHVMDLVTDMEAKGFALFPFTASPKRGKNLSSSSSASVVFSGNAGGDGEGQQARLPLDPGVMFQLLARFCDLKIPEESPRFPAYFFDVCPQLRRARSEGSPRSPEAEGRSSASCSSPSSTPEKSSRDTSFSVHSQEEVSDDGESLSGLKAFEAFLQTPARVNACRVCINWVKLHRLLAVAVFHESGVCARVQCGMTELAYLPVHWMRLQSFTAALAEKLSALPLFVCAEANHWLDACVADYRGFLRRREEARMQHNIQQARQSPSAFVPHVDLEALTDLRLLESVRSIPVLRYAVAKRALETAEADTLADEDVTARRRKASPTLPLLTSLELLQVNTFAFPELRLPPDSPAWEDDVGSQACVISDSDKKGPESSQPRAGVSGTAAGRGWKKMPFASSSSAGRGPSMNGNDLRRETIDEGVPRGLSVYEDACREAKKRKGAMASHFAVLAGLAFYSEGLLLHVAEEHLPLETRERFAVLFMCKSPWWDTEISPFVAPTLLGKDLMETVAGPPRRYCRARQVVLHAATDREAKKDDAGVVFFSHNLPLPFWDV
ncbi:UNVERIFIED_CONTAM: hypothetical protein HHA_319720 [Hammondia hammondi]|eukprot:XP_008885184.1 hypothetical protein HHA_319720 [Hammondia hammondi]